MSCLFDICCLILQYEQTFLKGAETMNREYKERMILQRMEDIKGFSDILIDILYGLLYG